MRGFAFCRPATKEFWLDYSIKSLLALVRADMNCAACRNRTRILSLYPDFVKFVYEPAVGIEPTAYCLQNSCSTAELRRQIFYKIEDSRYCSKSKICTLSEQSHCFATKLRRHSKPSI